MDLQERGNGVRKFVTIECETFEEMAAIREKIHNQLVGNQDYVDRNIVLNGSDDRYEQDNSIHLIFFEECEEIPEITI